jgi:hypothetical protein
MTSPRVLVPRLFDEEWDSIIIATYGADLAFYERDLWRQVGRAKNRLIFADSRQVQRRIVDESSGSLRHLNRSYILAPLRLGGAAHAKFILLLTEDRGLLAVGSGNLGMNGYTSQGECFTTYLWSAEDSQHLHAFVAAKDFLTKVTSRELVDEIVKPRLQQAWQDAPWIYSTVDEPTSTVRHNLEKPLLAQFIDVIDGRPVRELIVHAPFYDHQCRALSELMDRTRPEAVQILLQERITSVDPMRLSEVLSTAPSEVKVRTVQAQERCMLHAKFLIARLNSSEVCLQGSPNISTPALLQDSLTGNIEIANLLEGPSGAFEHLVSDLVISAEPVEISSLGLSLIQDEDKPDDDDYESFARELSWVSPRLTGIFQGEIETPPCLIIGESTVEDVDWSLEAPQDFMTPFTAVLGESAAAKLNRVDSVSFVFDNDRRTAPAYPYHLQTLIALSSGQGRTDLLKQAGDFDLNDEELEQLLVQLDEVLIVDGQSLWRMLKRKVPQPADEEESMSLSYDDLDWDAIQSHPKLAQYRTWEQRGHTNDPSGLGILLGSIADRFRSEVRRRKGEGGNGESDTEIYDDPLDDLANTIDAEDEEAAEAEYAEQDQHQTTARARARKQFRSFVKRFVSGLTDDSFIHLVGPSVIVPSYIIFNHLCWKLAQLDLIDRPFVINAQIELWRFFWGDATAPGYLTTMSEAEQLEAIKILDTHCAEAVLFASVYQAYDIVWGLEDADVVHLRDQWRVILMHDLGGVDSASAQDAAMMSRSDPDPLTLADFVADLAGLIEYTTNQEVLTAIAEVLGCSTTAISRKERKVHRGHLGAMNVTVFEVDDSLVDLDSSQAQLLFSELARLRPEEDYFRVSHVKSRAVAYADYELNVGLWFDPEADDELEFKPPDPSLHAWDAVVERLLALVA